MDIPANVFAEEWLLAALLVLAFWLARAYRSAKWEYVREHSHIYLGAIVFASLLWVLRAGIGSNLNLHFLGATIITLMFGWELALFALGAVVSLTVWRLDAGFTAIPLNTLIMGGIPIFVTHRLLHWSQNHLPLNIFIYIFINSFLAAILGSIGVVLTSSLLLLLSGTFSGHYLQYNYLAYIPLLMFPEGVLNGMLAAILTIYAPVWIRTFDDSLYLTKPTNGG